ncbi:hypothetical protein SCA6_015762 [Theobroma cacao]
MRNQIAFPFLPPAFTCVLFHLKATSQNSSSSHRHNPKQRNKTNYKQHGAVEKLGCKLYFCYTFPSWNVTVTFQ